MDGDEGTEGERRLTFGGGGRKGGGIFVGELVKLGTRIVRLGGRPLEDERREVAVEEGGEGVAEDGEGEGATDEVMLGPSREEAMRGAD